MRKIVILGGLIILSLSSCKGIETVLSPNKYEFSKNATAGTINSKFLPIKDNNSKTDNAVIGYASLSAHFFDASKRIGISTFDINRSIDPPENGKPEKDNGVVFRPRYLAEEQPDIAYEIANTFATQLSGSTGDNLEANIALASSYLQTVSKLTNKSQTLNLLRTIGYRMNESAFNGDLENEKYDRIFSEVICLTKDLQIAEFDIEQKKSEYQYKSYEEFNKLLFTIKELDVDNKLVEELIKNFITQNGHNENGISKEELENLIKETNSLLEKISSKKKEE
ncbi:hypothetical protein [Dokdonia sp.]|uniref:hypothetical protein n=1 Tax=Dokdonia sp. TaxID=2024995 RepID=UPI003267BB7F